MFTMRELGQLQEMTITRAGPTLLEEGQLPSRGIRFIFKLTKEGRIEIGLRQYELKHEQVHFSDQAFQAEKQDCRERNISFFGQTRA